DWVEPRESYVIRPAVAADDPDALLDQYVGERQELSGLVRINRAQFFFERRHALALDVDVSLIFLFGGQDRARQFFTDHAGQLFKQLGGELLLLVDRDAEAKPELGVVFKQ